MGQELIRLQRRKKAFSKMNEMTERPENVLVIHYSCESFYDREDGRTPRITSIAVRNLASGQTDSFSIHKVAEENGINIDSIPKYYDNLERTMLDRFFEFIGHHQDFMWIHWNMRDGNYGFAAIEHRHRVLKGNPKQIIESKKFDLARALIDIYGVGYIGHPRLESVIAKNKITDRDFLTGKQEADAFDDKQFVKLLQSTLRKVDTLANIFERTVNGTLKTNATWREQHGYTLPTVVEYLRKHWIVTFIIVLGGVFAFFVNGFDLLERFFNGSGR